jgi:hypothetical protein
MTETNKTLDKVIETFTPAEMRVLQRFFKNLWHRFPSSAKEGSNILTKNTLINFVINYSEGGNHIVATQDCRNEVANNVIPETRGAERNDNIPSR